MNSLHLLHLCCCSDTDLEGCFWNLSILHVLNTKFHHLDVDYYVRSLDLDSVYQYIAVFLHH